MPTTAFNPTDLVLSLAIQTQSSRGDDASAPFGSTLGPVVVADHRRKISHMTKIWHSDLALKELGWA
jgi:hypothetical protein